MLKVEDFAEMRRAHRDGMSIRAIARRFRRSRRSVRKALSRPEPQPYARAEPYPAPKLGPFFAVIDAILAADEQAPRKQRHTAAQLFRRLKSEQGYTGGYDQVRRYLQRRRRQQRETFIPLSHDPGQRLEVDFGHIAVDFPEGRRQVPVLLVTWSYSNCPFAIALPTERTEAILHGLVEAFTYFGCVAREVWIDNPKTVANAIFPGRERRLNPRYAALASHYNFEPLFCLPRRGNEKPLVENRVYDLQRRWATPVPRMQDLAELNAHLRRCCEQERLRCSGEHDEPIGVRFARDQTSALPLPEHPFDPCVAAPARVDKYQMVRFDHNQYSVPRAWAFQTVTVKAYVEHIEVVSGDQVVARHRRSYGRSEQILDPLHYLVTLGRRPAALDHAAVYRDWQLPTSFSELRQELEARHGRGGGVRHYIRVLQLLAEHPLKRVEQAVRVCRQRGLLDAERIRAHAEFLAARPGPAAPCVESDAVPSGSVEPSRLDLTRLQVPLPDLGRFNLLLQQGEEDVSAPEPAAQDQLEAVAFARHECGV